LGRRLRSGIEVARQSGDCLYSPTYLRLNTEN
jgi:hypothetical protein